MIFLNTKNLFPQMAQIWQIFKSFICKISEICGLHFQQSL